MSIDKSLISGSTSMLVMKLLEEQDMYGYQMIAALKKRSNNVFELKAGTLYPLLHGMESKGYLTSYEQEEGGRKSGRPTAMRWRVYLRRTVHWQGMYKGGVI